MSEACVGQTVRCPACAGTFEARGEDVAAVGVGIATTAGPQKSVSIQPRTGPHVSEPGAGRPETARSRRFLGGWQPVRQGLVWIMGAQGLDLVVLGLYLVVMGMGVMVPDPDAHILLWEQWGWPVMRLGLMFSVVAGVCMTTGYCYCQHLYPSGVTREFASAAVVILCVYLVRPMFALALLGGPLGAIHDLEVESFWEVWFFWAELLPRWITEGMLVFFLYDLGRKERHEPTLSRLRWAIVLLAAKVVLQLAVATGLFRWWHTLLAGFRLDMVWVGTLLCIPLLFVRLAVTAQLLRVLLAACSALAGAARVRGCPALDLPLGKQ